MISRNLSFGKRERPVMLVMLVSDKSSSSKFLFSAEKVKEVRPDVSETLNLFNAKRCSRPVILLTPE